MPGRAFSVRNWVLIVVMALFGRTLGALPLDSALKTGIYVMVGIMLPIARISEIEIFGSRSGSVRRT